MCLVGLVRYYHRAPDQLSADEVQAYIAHMFTERKRSWSAYPRSSPAEFNVPARKPPQRLPDILSREEACRLPDACTHPRDRLLLATTYAPGCVSAN